MIVTTGGRQSKKMIKIYKYCGFKFQFGFFVGQKTAELNNMDVFYKFFSRYKSV